MNNSDLLLSQEGVTRGVARTTPVALRFYPLDLVEALRGNKGWSS